MFSISIQLHGSLMNKLIFSRKSCRLQVTHKSFMYHQCNLDGVF